MAYYITHLLHNVCDEQMSFNMLYTTHLFIIPVIICRPTLPPAHLQCHGVSAALRRASLVSSLLLCSASATVTWRG